MLHSTSIDFIANNLKRFTVGEWNKSDISVDLKYENKINSLWTVNYL
jgi:hypothetical protein